MSANNKTVTHPIQPIENVSGFARFKPNKIVQFILDNSQFINMNVLAAMNFTDEDRAQFAQLIGYDVRGFCDLPYVSEELSHRAQLAEDDLNPSNPYAHEQPEAYVEVKQQAWVRIAEGSESAMQEAWEAAIGEGKNARIVFANGSTAS